MDERRSQAASAPEAAKAPDPKLLAVVLLLIAVFAVCQGLSYPLLAFILQREGHSPALIGLNTAATPLGLVLAAPFLPALASRVGAARLAFSCALLIAAMLALIGAVANVWAWFPARFLIGCAITGIYTISETWIIRLAPPALRGRVLGLFSAVLALGFAAGPLVIALVGSAGWAPFLIAIAMVLTVALLLLPVMDRLPDFAREKEDLSVLGFLPLAPFLLATVAGVAAFDQSALALLPVYGFSHGLSEGAIAVALVVLTAGNILFQVPIGWLSDRWSRRGTLLLLAGLTVAGAGVLPVAIGDSRMLLPVLFVWGSAAYGLYTLSLVALGEGFEGARLVAGNAAFALMWGVGGMLGPSAFGFAMNALGPEGLPLAVALLYGALFAAVALSREFAPARKAGRAAD